MKIILIILPFALYSCMAQSSEQTGRFSDSLKTSRKNSTVAEYYRKHVNDSIASKSNGSVSNGSLENASLMPFTGKNYCYFDTASYLGGRAFAHRKLIASLHDTYNELDQIHPGRQFVIMECSNKHGGKIHPHRTHQNGLSTDFMMPLLKNNQPYYGLDSLGATHYLLDFDSDGKYLKDSTIHIDFELLASYMLVLQEKAMRNGLTISKIILKLDLKDNLLATQSGKILSNRGVYFARNLDPLINSLHDDHFHVDFELLKE